MSADEFLEMWGHYDNLDDSKFNYKRVKLMLKEFEDFTATERYERAAEWWNKYGVDNIPNTPEGKPHPYDIEKVIQIAAGLLDPEENK